MEPVRVYVGADRSQALAIQVLEHSIRRHTSHPVELHPMVDLPVPMPKDPRQRPRTGFSFARFCIPKLAGYRGRAIYMDADMLVFKDIRSLWDIPMEGRSVLVQRELGAESIPQKGSAPKKRVKQCAVMLLDCAKLTWDVERITEDLNEKKYTYEELLQQLCLVAPEEIGHSIPFEWNSLEILKPETCNLHYTDMPTQPWVSPHNLNDGPWLEEVRLMLADGSLTETELRREIELGYFRPSLCADLFARPRVPAAIVPLWRKAMGLWDKFAGFVPHASVRKANLERSALNPAMAAG